MNSFDVHRNTGRPRLQLPQCTRQIEWLSGERRAGCIGLVLAGTGDGQTDDHRRDRGEDETHQGNDPAKRILPAAAPSPTEPERHAGGNRQGGSEHRGDGADENVPVADVRQLVPDDTFEFGTVEDLHDPGGDGHGGVARVTPGRECVGLW